MSVEHSAKEQGQRHGSRLMSLSWSKVESGADLGQRLGHLDPASQQVASSPSDRRRLPPPTPSVREDVDERSVLAGLWGSKTPIPLVTCGFGRAGPPVR